LISRESPSASISPASSRPGLRSSLPARRHSRSSVHLDQRHPWLTRLQLDPKSHARWCAHMGSGPEADSYLPIHCKTIQTRCSAIQTLLQRNSNNSTPPSKSPTAETCTIAGSGVPRRAKPRIGYVVSKPGHRTRNSERAKTRPLLIVGLRRTSVGVDLSFGNWNRFLFFDNRNPRR